jgi:hypothetical protein
MAELTGVFKADFSDFYSAVQKAEKHLVEFEDDANKVTASLSRMTDNFSGKKLMQDATLAARAVEDLGGVSTLTAKELQIVGAKASEAADKMVRMGKDVPPEVQKIADAYDDLQKEQDETAQKTGTLYNEYKSFDDVLDVAGVNVNKQAKALSQLKDMLGTNVSSMTKFQVAGAVTAAFMVGWKIGEFIDKWTGLSTAIGEATAKLLGWNTAAEKGGSGSLQDTLDRASAIAKRTVTDFSEAQRIIRGEIDKTQTAFARANAAETSAAYIKKYKDEINGLARSGVLDDLKKKLEEGQIPQAELGRIYHVSAEALDILNKGLDVHKQRQDAIKKSNEEMVALQDRIFGRDLVVKANEYATAVGGAMNAWKLTPEARDEINKTAIAAVDHLGKIGLGATETAKNLRDLITATTDWAKVNAAVAASPNPFAASEQARRAKIRSGGMAQMDVEQGFTQAQIDAADYWAHAGEQAEAAQKAFYAARDAEKSAADQAMQTASANNVLAGSFSVVTKSAAEWRDQAKRLNEDAARMETTTDPRAAGAGSWYSQYIRNLRSGAKSAEASANYEDKIAGTGAYGWTVNVNAMQGINGDQVANELVAGMRRRGLSFG